MHKTGEKATETAAPLEIDLQLFAEGEGGAPAGDIGVGAPTDNSSAIINDPYASGGPEPPENQPAELIDFENYDFGAEGTGGAGEPPAGDNQEPPRQETPDGNQQEQVPNAVKEQSPEANAAFAEMRRQNEAFQKQLADRDAWVEQTFGATHNLHTWEQYQQAVEQTNQQQAIQRQQEMQTRPQQVAQQTYQQLLQQGYDEPIARILANSEGDRVAANLRNEALQNEIAGIKNQSKQEKELAQQQTIQQQQEAAKKQIIDSLLADHKQLREEYGDLIPADSEQFFGSLDPSTREKLNKGYSLYDSWYLSNRGKITEQTQKAAAQKTLNNLNSKSHLKTEGDGAGDSNASTIPLPADTLQMYMDSGMTEKQARAFHKKLYG